jgi:hypothetical protein
VTLSPVEGCFLSPEHRSGLVEESKGGWIPPCRQDLGE